MAEDDPLFRRLLQSRLQSWGYGVVTAENGADAWELIQQPNPPALLILDWIMPGIDGIELCRRIRSTHGNRYQYILLVSGKDQKQNVIDGLEAGADDYLTKPFDIGELRARLLAGKRILTLQNELIQAREALRFQATHDALTGLWSRGATLHLLGSELQRGVRPHALTGVLMVDIDHFKTINDTHGHLIGDSVLKEAASRLNHAVRNYDFVGRYGGEEFLVVLSTCTRDDLERIAERIRHAFAAMPISTDAAVVNITVSVGCVIGSSDIRAVDLLEAADRALYEAKRTGRNRIVIGSCNNGVASHTQAVASGTELASSGT